jgi:hypothetical protein
MYKSFLVFVSIFAITLMNCATYLLTTDSLQKQIECATPVEGTFTFTTGGLFLFRKMEYNGIRHLIVNDKNGKEKSILVTNQTGIRITTKDGKRTTFYFDTMFFKDNCIVGQKTHFFPMPIKPIAFGDIVKIEIQ